MLARENTRSGLPTFIKILVRVWGNSSKDASSISKGSKPEYILPSSPPAQETVISCPVFMATVAFSQPTIAGMPISLAIIAA